MIPFEVTDKYGQSAPLILNEIQQYYLFKNTRRCYYGEIDNKRTNGLDEDHSRKG